MSYHLPYMPDHYLDMAVVVLDELILNMAVNLGTNIEVALNYIVL